MMKARGEKVAIGAVVLDIELTEFIISSHTAQPRKYLLGNRTVDHGMRVLCKGPLI